MTKAHPRSLRQTSDVPRPLKPREGLHMHFTTLDYYLSYLYILLQSIPISNRSQSTCTTWGDDKSATYLGQELERHPRRLPLVLRHPTHLPRKTHLHGPTNRDHSRSGTHYLFHTCRVIHTSQQHAPWDEKRANTSHSWHYAPYKRQCNIVYLNPTTVMQCVLIRHQLATSRQSTNFGTGIQDTVPTHPFIMDALGCKLHHFVTFLNRGIVLCLITTNGMITLKQKIPVLRKYRVIRLLRGAIYIPFDAYGAQTLPIQHKSSFCARGRSS